MNTKKAILVVCAALISTLSSTASAFESTEHMVIGDSVKLQFPDNQLHSHLKLSNGLEVSYGEILALGGDYFAIPELPISQGKTLEDRKQRFLKTFETFAESPQTPKIALQLVASFRKTLDEIKQGEKEGKSASETFAEIGGSLLAEYNVITGGGCSITPLFPLGFATLQLISEANWDHFVPYALNAYLAGHLVALERAVQAGKTQNDIEALQALECAYAMNAFACHYLSDSFSAGHMRTPRKELSEHVDSTAIAALLMDYMHGEDSINGLKVRNLNGKEWTAYGDGYYFDLKNVESRGILEQVVQLSADEIYFAYQHGFDPNEGKISEQMNNLLPQFTLLESQESHFNTSPLFLWDNKEGVLKRREEINDLYGDAWKSNWWGWSTLLDLANYYKPQTSRQQALHSALFMHCIK